MKKYLKLLLFIMISISPIAEADTIRINDPVFGYRELNYAVVGDYAVIEGDILLGKLSVLKAPGAIIENSISGSHWDNGIIPFEIDEKMPSKLRSTIGKAIKYWMHHSHLKFIELTPENRKAHPDYISFSPDPGISCSSFVGRIKGKQVILMAPRCKTMSMVHELGHAIGLWHEQSRADRDQFIRIAWENIIEEKKDNFIQHLDSSTDFGDYDYDSIMHYSSFAFSKNGEKTIIPLNEKVKIGQRDHLSAKDIAATNHMYPSKGSIKEP